MTPDDPDGEPSDRPADADPETDGVGGGAGAEPADVEPADDRQGGDGDVPEDAFVEMDVGDVSAAAPPFEERDGGRATAVVPKRSYCERCEHFADPPSVACTHEGTEIVEVVDTDHFRVLECPVVARRREIGDATPGAADDPG